MLHWRGNGDWLSSDQGHHLGRRFFFDWRTTTVRPGWETGDGFGWKRVRHGPSTRQTRQTSLDLTVRVGDVHHHAAAPHLGLGLITPAGLATNAKGGPFCEYGKAYK